MPQDNGRRWLASQLRATAFPAPNAEIASDAWWEAVVGPPPESVVAKRTHRQLDGSFEAGRVTLVVQPMKVDWLYAPGDADEPPDELPVLGGLERVLPPFLERIHRWFEYTTCPDVLRLAFGAVLNNPTRTRQDGYREVARLLPGVALDPDNSSDFLYQINRPRQSRVAPPAVRVNRLSKWSIAAYQILAIGGGGVQAGAIAHSAHVELDINTIPEGTAPLPRIAVPLIFGELVELALEIAERGDVP